MNKQKLWTRDFTIITLGTVVSMLGNNISGFAMGLLVLDYTNSTFLYALYLVAFFLPSVVLPMIAGPYLDNFSRKKVIYTLDFISAGLYLMTFFLLRGGIFSYGLFLVLSLLEGSIQSIYTVAYESLYPNLVSEGNYSKAYSISSMLYPLTAMMLPLAAYLYDTVGLTPLFLFNAVTFFGAAVMETQIKAEETHIKKEIERFSWRRYKADFREGIDYLRAEKGLLVITVYFCVTMFANSYTTVVLPYFKETPGLGAQVYSYVMAFAVAGRFIGGGIHYTYMYPVKKKFAIALFVYITIWVFEGVYLFLPVSLMIVLQFLVGVFGVTSYNIRISATQSYIPDSHRGRFNGTFNMITTAGMVAGQLLAGALGDVFPKRGVALVFNALGLAAALLIMARNRNHVKPIYNRQV